MTNNHCPERPKLKLSFIVLILLLMVPELVSTSPQVITIQSAQSGVVEIPISSNFEEADFIGLDPTSTTEATLNVKFKTIDVESVAGVQKENDFKTIVATHGGASSPITDILSLSDCIPIEGFETYGDGDKLPGTGSLNDFLNSGRISTITRVMVCLKNGVHNYVRFQTFHILDQPTFDPQTILHSAKPLYKLNPSNDPSITDTLIPVINRSFDVKCKRAIAKEYNHFLLCDEQVNNNSVIEEYIVLFFFATKTRRTNDFTSRFHRHRISPHQISGGFKPENLEMDILYQNQGRNAVIIYAKRSTLVESGSEPFYHVLIDEGYYRKLPNEDFLRWTYYDISDIDFFKQLKADDPQGKFKAWIFGASYDRNTRHEYFHIGYEKDNKHYIAGFFLSSIQYANIETQLVYRLTFDSLAADTMIGASVVINQFPFVSIFTQKRIYTMQMSAYRDPIHSKTIPSVPGVTFESFSVNQFSVYAIDTYSQSTTFDPSYYLGSIVRVNNLSYEGFIPKTFDRFPAITEIIISIEIPSTNARSTRSTTLEVKKIKIDYQLKTGKFLSFKLSDNTIDPNAIVHISRSNQPIFIMEPFSYKIINLGMNDIINVKIKDMITKDEFSVTSGTKQFLVKLPNLGDIMNDSPIISIDPSEIMVLSKGLQRIPIQENSIIKTSQNLVLGGDVDQDKSVVLIHKIAKPTLTTNLRLPQSAILNEAFPLGVGMFVLSEKSASGNLAQKTYYRIVQCKFNIALPETDVFKDCDLMVKEGISDQQLNQQFVLQPGFTIENAMKYKNTVVLIVKDVNNDKSEIYEFNTKTFETKQNNPDIDAVKNMFNDFYIKSSFIKVNTLYLILKGATTTTLLDIDYIDASSSFVLDDNISSMMSDMSQFRNFLEDVYPVESQDKLVYLKLKQFGLDKQIISHIFNRYNVHTRRSFETLQMEATSDQACPLGNQLIEYDNTLKVINIKLPFRINENTNYLKTGSNHLYGRAYQYSYAYLGINGVFSMNCVTKASVVQLFVQKTDISKAVITLRPDSSKNIYHRIHSIVAVDSSVVALRTSSSDPDLINTVLVQDLTIEPTNPFQTLILIKGIPRVYIDFDLDQSTTSAQITLAVEGTPSSANQRWNLKINHIVVPTDVELDKQPNKIYKKGDIMDLRSLIPGDSSDFLRIQTYFKVKPTLYKFNPRFIPVAETSFDSLSIRHYRGNVFYKKMVQAGRMLGLFDSNNGHSVSIISGDNRGHSKEILFSPSRLQCNISPITGTNEGPNRPQMLIYCGNSDPSYAYFIRLDDNSSIKQEVISISQPANFKINDTKAYFVSSNTVGEVITNKLIIIWFIADQATFKFGDLYASNYVYKSEDRNSEKMVFPSFDLRKDLNKDKSHSDNLLIRGIVIQSQINTRFWTLTFYKDSDDVRISSVDYKNKDQLVAANQLNSFSENDIQFFKIRGTSATPTMRISEVRECKSIAQDTDYNTIQCLLQTFEGALVKLVFKATLAQDPSTFAYSITVDSFSMTKFIKPSSNTLNEVTHTSEYIAVQYKQNKNKILGQNKVFEEAESIVEVCDYQILVYPNSADELLKPIAKMDCQEDYLDPKLLTTKKKLAALAIGSIDDKLSFARFVDYSKLGENHYVASDSSFIKRYTIGDENIEFLTDPEEIIPSLKSRLRLLAQEEPEKIRQWETLRLKLYGMESLGEGGSIVKVLTDKILVYTDPNLQEEEEEKEEEEEDETKTDEKPSDQSDAKDIESAKKAAFIAITATLVSFGSICGTCICLFFSLVVCGCIICFCVGSGTKKPNSNGRNKRNIIGLPMKNKNGPNPNYTINYRNNYGNNLPSKRDEVNSNTLNYHHDADSINPINVNVSQNSKIIDGLPPIEQVPKNTIEAVFLKNNDISDG